MLKTLVFTPLLPLIYFQGKQLRKNTPKLPEALGERQGVTGSGPTISLLIIGDSAAAGVGVSDQQQALLGQLVGQLQQHYQVHWYLHAKSGATTAETLNSIASINADKFDVVITSLGMNDMIQGVQSKAWLNKMTALKNELKQRFSPNIIITSGLPPVGKFPKIPSPLNWFLGSQASIFNHALAKQSEIDEQAVYLEIGLEDNRVRKIPDEYLASDGFHPGQKVYQLWAEQAFTLVNDSFKR